MNILRNIYFAHSHRILNSLFTITVLFIMLKLADDNEKIIARLLERIKILEKQQIAQNEELFLENNSFIDVSIKMNKGQKGMVV